MLDEADEPELLEEEALLLEELRLAEEDFCDEELLLTVPPFARL